jgi:type IX secretion system PorP/SprF family membrane protein
MKRCLLHIALALPAMVGAQADGLWTQYMLNLAEANIAHTGSPDALYATLRYSARMTGWEGAPRTSVLMLQAPAASGKLGLGLVLEAETLGVRQTVRPEAIAAYKLHMGKGLLSFALSGGIRQERFHTELISAKDEEDWLVDQQRRVNTVPVMGAGLMFSTLRFYAGVDVRNANRASRDWYPNAMGRDYRHYRAVIGGAIPLSEAWVFRPSAMVRIAEQGSPQADLTMSVFWQERIWTGIGYRPGYGWSLFADWHLSRRFRLGYSVDLATGSSVRFVPPGHEVFLAYGFNLKENRPPSIRYF